MATFFITPKGKDYIDCDDQDATCSVHVGQIKCNLGVLNFVVRNSAAGGKCLDLSMGINEMGTTKWPQRTTVTFQMDLSNMASTYRRRSGQQDITLGPQSAAVVDAHKGTVVTTTFALPDSTSSESRWTVKQLCVTVDCVADLVLPVGQTRRTALFVANSPDLIHFIDNPGLSDCRIELQDGSHVSVCKLVLARASPFFMTMFTEPQWSAGSSSGGGKVGPIKFDSWSVKALVPCVIHMYTGWIPYHGELPQPSALKDLMDKHQVVPAKYSLTEWLEVLHLAQMLELLDMTNGVKRAMVGLLEE